MKIKIDYKTYLLIELANITLVISVCYYLQIPVNCIVYFIFCITFFLYH